MSYWISIYVINYITGNLLTPDLEKHGGHIAYGIRPSEKKKGYGKQQLLD